MSDYFVEGGDVLDNKLGISDEVKLREVEEDFFSDAAAAIINEKLPEKLDFDFLKNLHRRLFGEVYDFAGKIRTVNITKPDSSIPFCYADFIETEAEKIFNELEEKHYLKDLDLEDFCKEIAKLSSELNALHPFREGNGRTIRLFLQLLGVKAGYVVKYAMISHDEIIEADKLAFLGDDSKLQEMYRKIVAKI